MSYQLIYVFWLSPYPFHLLSCYPCSLCQLFIWQLTIWTFKQTTAMQYMYSIVSILHTHTWQMCEWPNSRQLPSQLANINKTHEEFSWMKLGSSMKTSSPCFDRKVFLQISFKKSENIRIWSYCTCITGIHCTYWAKATVIHCTMCNAYCIKIPRKVVQCTLQIA